MHMHKVNSSQISAMGLEGSTMRVNFIHGNTTYEYQNVEQEVFDRLLNSRSIGKEFAKLIKAHPDKYPYRKVS